MFVLIHAEEIPLSLSLSLSLSFSLSLSLSLSLSIYICIYTEKHGSLWLLAQKEALKGENSE